MQDQHSVFLLGDKSYDFLKKLVQVILPACGSAYFALAGIWDLPHADKVTGTIVVITTFLGICLGISSAQYKATGAGYDGQILIQPQEDGPTQVKFITKTEDPLAIADKKQATFKVDMETPIASAEIEPEVSPEDNSPPRKRAKSVKKTAL